MNTLTVASFDIGKKNFAMMIETFDCSILTLENNIENICRNGKIIYADNVSIQDSKKNYLFEYLFKFMISKIYLWKQCNIFIIEKQVKFNPTALQISHHLEAFIKTTFPFQKTIMFSSKHKTLTFDKVFEKKRDRKSWTVEKTFEILNKRKDVSSISLIESFNKKDDICDCFCQLQAFKFLISTKKIKL